jgi:hypothetical protein
MAHIGFDKLKGELASRPGVTNPGGLAAFIGAKKYGAGKMQAASKAGKPLADSAKKKNRNRSAHEGAVALASRT